MFYLLLDWDLMHANVRRYVQVAAVRGGMRFCSRAKRQHFDFI